MKIYKRDKEVHDLSCDCDNCIPFDRYDYNDWIAIGHICFNNFDGSDIGFKIFNEYSEQDKKKYSGIEKLLNTYNFFKKQNPKNRLSYKQLKRWHDEDYPCKNKYEKYYKEGRLIEEMNVTVPQVRILYPPLNCKVLKLVDRPNCLLGDDKEIKSEKI